VIGRGIHRMLAARRGGLPETVELAVPDLARERAEEICRLSRDYSEHAAGFGSPREVLGPALLYGLAHMHERYERAVELRQCDRAFG
jgi:hypothetical protein